MGEQVAAGKKWGCSSVGRAPALQAGGHEFESHHLHSVFTDRHAAKRMQFCVAERSKIWYIENYISKVNEY